MTAAEEAARSRIGALALGSWIVFTSHAIEEMRDELVERADVRSVLIDAVDCLEQESERWLLAGPGTEETALHVVCELGARNVVVVTVFRRTA